MSGYFQLLNYILHWLHLRPNLNFNKIFLFPCLILIFNLNMDFGIRRQFYLTNEYLHIHLHYLLYACVKIKTISKKGKQDLILG